MRTNVRVPVTEPAAKQGLSALHFAAAERSIAAFQEREFVPVDGLGDDVKVVDGLNQAALRNRIAADHQGIRGSGPEVVDEVKPFIAHP